MRPARIVKVAGVQNSIVLPTTDPVGKQRDALFEKIGEIRRSEITFEILITFDIHPGTIIDAAGKDGVNILCLQEAWSE